MATRTYIPAILVVANYLKKFVNKNSERLKQYLGDGGFAVITLIVDLCLIFASLVSAGHEAGEAWSDFNSINTLNATTQNQIQAAIAKFWESIGVTP